MGPLVLLLALSHSLLALANICAKHPELLYQCDSDGSGQCVSRSFVCDGDKDCENGNDELYCAVDCESQGLFRCAIGHPCIPGSWKCDGDNDCVDGSDESTAICETKCDGADQFLCKSGSCIAATSVCDGTRDCFDNSDESPPHCMRTPEPPCNSTYRFDCQEQVDRCVPLSWKCDGEEDCAGGVDERGCPNSRPTEAKQTGPTVSSGGNAGGSLPPILKCSDREFRCLDGDRCIPYPHRCDSQVDCKDGSDEDAVACKTAPRCPPRLQFSCITTPQCIPWNKHCDGNDDCQDNSDEYGCGSKNVTSFLVEACEGMFKCGSGECLSYKRVCDNKTHCSDGSDEENCFINECQNGENDCVGNQKCVDLRTGYDCTCSKGYRITSTGCEDIDECAEFGWCQQICTNTIGGYSCSCETGFHLRPDDRSCKSEDGNARLLYAHGRDVRTMDMATLKYKEIARSPTHFASFIAVAYHYPSKMAYFSDIQGHSIRAVPISGGESIELYGDVSEPEGLAVDWLNNRLYWTDTDRGHIVVASLDGNFRRTIVETEGSAPRGIAVDPVEGLVFWTDWGRWPHVGRANMDGSDVAILINDTDVAKWPNGVTIDVYGKWVFWCDGWYEKIVVMNYEGTKLKTLVSGGIGNVFGLALHDDKLLFSGWRAGKVFISGMLDGSHHYTIRSDVVDVKGIAVYQEEQQPLFFDNPCSRSRCSHHCVPARTSPSGFVCMCDAGIPLLSDDATCGHPEMLCDNSYCDWRGDCVKELDTGRMYCLCNKGFYGSSCEQTTRDEITGAPVEDSSSGNKLPIALGVVGGFLALAAIVAVVFVVLRRRNQRKDVNFENPVYDTGRDSVVVKAKNADESLSNGHPPQSHKAISGGTTV